MIIGNLFYYKIYENFPKLRRILDGPSASEALESYKKTEDLEH
jgi:hypothetical protein